MALHCYWCFNHCNIEQAILESEIDRDTFMRTPDECDAFSGKRLNLTGSPPKLKQRSRVFNRLMRIYELLSFGLAGCKSGRCIFRLTRLNKKRELLILSVYVDYRIVTGEAKYFEKLKTNLRYPSSPRIWVHCSATPVASRSGTTRTVP